MPLLIKLVSGVLSWLLAWFVGRKLVRSLLLLLLLVIGVGYMIPEQLSLPVARMRRNSYDQRSYWYYPWGKSVVHKGVDVFAPIGTPVTSATSGWVIFRGELPAGGQTVMVLGPKWRVHYYAHLSSFAIDRWAWIQLGDTVGKVGDTGNAKGRSPHLHYSIFTPIPYLWQADPKQYHWWFQPFFINPIPNLNAQLPNGPDRK